MKLVTFQNTNVYSLAIRKKQKQWIMVKPTVHQVLMFPYIDDVRQVNIARVSTAQH